MGGPEGRRSQTSGPTSPASADFLNVLFIIHSISGHLESDRWKKNRVRRLVEVLQTEPFNQQEGKRGYGNNSFPGAAAGFFFSDCCLLGGRGGTATADLRAGSPCQNKSDQSVEVSL